MNEKRGKHILVGGKKKAPSLRYSYIYLLTQATTKSGRQPAPERIKGAGRMRLANEKAPTGMFGRVVLSWNVQPLASSQTFQGNTIGPNRPQRRFLSAWHAPAKELDFLGKQYARAAMIDQNLQQIIPFLQT